ncbi:cytidine deaminase [Haloarchaeobius sp. DT45]|uniref:cytidine deaminase n=1 Tax=Haloarchaeobius sp. DT45 TaxID=3446116 RepID=UPI003F6C606D
MDDEALIEAAREMLDRAYAPYSEYTVGAAIETTDGTVYAGCNIENANYSNSLHAEEVAISQAITEGHTEFTKIAVTSGKRDGVTPCGMCRQTLAEFCDDDFVVLCDEKEGYAAYELGTLLPDTITAEMVARDGE